MRDDKNLLTETIEVLRDNGKTPDDVRWVGWWDGSRAISWVEFAKTADREYDSGFGYHQVSLKLVVVGDNWWMKRHEYDGSEWWDFLTLPTLQPDALPLLWVWEVEEYRAHRYSTSGRGME